MRKKSLMKILTAIMFALVLAFSAVMFAACGDNPPPECTQHVDANSDGKCDKCGKDMPKDPVIDPEPEPEPEPSLKDELDPSALSYKFEAECCTLVADNPNCHAGNEGPQTNNPSGGQYVMAIDHDGMVTCTFEIYSDAAAKAVLSMGMGLGQARSVTDMFDILINDEYTVPENPVIFPEWSTVQYYDWTEKEVMLFDLKEGVNTVQFNKNLAGSAGLNFDYIAVTTTAELQWNSEYVNGGHTYGEWSMTKEPTLSEKGAATSYCVTCREFKELELPAISTENGYVVVSQDESGIKWKLTLDEGEFEFTTYPNSFKFECESMAIEGGDPVNPADQVVAKPDGNNPSGGQIVGGMNNNTGSITLTIESNIETSVKMIVCFGRNSNEIKFNATHKLMLGDAEISVSDDVVFTRCDGNEWVDWTEFEIATFTLQKGTNVITLSNTDPGDNTAASGNFDYFRFIADDDNCELTQITA